MPRAHHLREVDDRDVLVLVDHDVELVEVAVHQPARREVRQLVDTLSIHPSGLSQPVPLRQRDAVDHGHQHRVSVHVHRDGHREPVFPERLQGRSIQSDGRVGFIGVRWS
eukprot:20012-Pelagococcus_subviridis.AAC.1